MESIFPDVIKKLPKAKIPLDGVTIYISQADLHQIVFMEFTKDCAIPEHAHESQWEYVLHGSVDVWIDGKHHHFQKGDQFFIPSGVKHHAKVYAGYTSIAFFDEKQRYIKKD
jgi:quercetin dioxygenase-like cupin family protein